MDLAVIRGGRRIFAGASFTIEPGQIATLRGPNGAGKTTLLRALAGLLPVAGGEAWAGDASTLSDKDLYQERVAYAGHADALKAAQTPRESLVFWGGYFCGDALDLAERVEAALERFGVSAIADEPTGRLSAGQRRRTALARMLLLDRPIWLLDEPTASLDAAGARILGETIEEHAAAGGVTLIALHGASPVREDLILDMSAFKAQAIALKDPFLDGFDEETRA